MKLMSFSLNGMFNKAQYQKQNHDLQHTIQKMKHSIILNFIKTNQSDEIKIILNKGINFETMIKYDNINQIIKPIDEIFNANYKKIIKFFQKQQDFNQNQDIEYEKLINDYQILDNKNGILENQNKELQNNILDLKEKNQKMEQTIDQMKKQLEKQEQLLKTQDTQIIELKHPKKIQELEEKLKTQNKYIENLKTQFQISLDANNTLKKDIENKNKEIKNKDQNIEELTKIKTHLLNSKCYIQQQEKQIKNLEQELENSNRPINEDKYKKEINKLKQTYENTVKNKDIQINELTEKNKKLQIELDNKIEKLETIGEQLENKNKDCLKYEIILTNDIKQLYQYISKSYKDIEQLNNLLEQSSKTLKEYKNFFIDNEKILQSIQSELKIKKNKDKIIQQLIIRIQTYIEKYIVFYNANQNLHQIAIDVKQKEIILYDFCLELINKSIYNKIFEEKDNNSKIKEFMKNEYNFNKLYLDNLEKTKQINELNNVIIDQSTQIIMLSKFPNIFYDEI